jgi:hypothetical protein
VEVHIQQVLEHAERAREARPPGLAATLNSAVSKLRQDFTHAISGSAQ